MDAYQNMKMSRNVQKFKFRWMKLKMSYLAQPTLGGFYLEVDLTPFRMSFRLELKEKVEKFSEISTIQRKAGKT